ncbi:MAG: polyhydroxyalkanoate synthesis repressor PhaR [Arenimonas sp.]
MSDTRIIKKYPNRRLYDTEISSYITLEDIRQLIIEGENFEVREAKSGKDITRSVLLQIIAEHEDIGQPILSAQLLTEIIRFYGDSLQGYIGSYLERSVDMFIDQQQSLRSQVSNIVGQTPWPLLNQITERNLELWKTLQEGILSPITPARKTKSSRKTHNTETSRS